MIAPAGTEQEWEYTDHTWWNGAIGEDYIIDPDGQTWKRSRPWFDSYGHWQRVTLPGITQNTLQENHNVVHIL